MENICELVRVAEKNFNQGSTQKSEYVNFNMKEDLDTIDDYLNSKFIS